MDPAPESMPDAVNSTEMPSQDTRLESTDQQALLEEISRLKAELSAEKAKAARDAELRKERDGRKADVPGLQSLCHIDKERDTMQDVTHCRSASSTARAPSQAADAQSDCATSAPSTSDLSGSNSSGSVSACASAREQCTSPSAPSKGPSGKGCKGPPVGGCKGPAGKGAKGPPVPGAGETPEGKGSKGPPVPGKGGAGPAPGKGEKGPPLPGKGGKGPPMPGGGKGKGKGGAPANTFVNVQVLRTRPPHPSSVGFAADPFLAKLSDDPDDVELLKSADKELKLNADNLPRTIFDTEVEGLPEVPELLGAHYFNKTQQVKKTGGRSVKKEEFSLLDTSELQRIEMIMHNVKRLSDLDAKDCAGAVSVIVNALLQCNSQVLRFTDLNSLRQVLNSTEDKRQPIAAFFEKLGKPAGNGTDNIRSPYCHYLRYELSKIDSLNERMTHMALASEFSDMVRDASNKLNTLKKGMDVLHARKLDIHKLLQVVRSICNDLNRGLNTKVMPRGFSLKCLDRVESAKSTRMCDYSVLHFALIMMDGFEFSDAEMKALREAKDLKSFAVYDACRSVTVSYDDTKKVAQRLKTAQPSDSQDGYLRSLEAFLEKLGPEKRKISRAATQFFMQYKEWATLLDDLDYLYPPTMDDESKGDLFDLMYNFGMRVNKCGKLLNVVKMKPKELYDSCKPDSDDAKKAQKEEETTNKESKDGGSSTSNDGVERAEREQKEQADKKNDNTNVSAIAASVTQCAREKSLGKDSERPKAEAAVASTGIVTKRGCAKEGMGVTVDTSGISKANLAMPPQMEVMMAAGAMPGGRSSPEETPRGELSSLPEETPRDERSSLPQETPRDDVSALPQETPRDDKSALPQETPRGDVSALPQETPRDDRSSLPQETPRDDRCSLPQETPRDGISSLPQETPRDEVSSLPQETPRDDISSLPQETPRDDISSLPQETPRDDISSLPQETPRDDNSTLPQETPRDDASSIPQETPRDDSSSIPQEIPSESEPLGIQRRRSSDFSSGEIGTECHARSVALSAPKKASGVAKSSPPVCTLLKTMPLNLPKVAVAVSVVPSQSCTTGSRAPIGSAASTSVSNSVPSSAAPASAPLDAPLADTSYLGMPAAEDAAKTPRDELEAQEGYKTPTNKATILDAAALEALSTQGSRPKSRNQRDSFASIASLAESISTVAAEKKSDGAYEAISVHQSSSDTSASRKGSIEETGSREIILDEEQVGNIETPKVRRTTVKSDRKSISEAPTAIANVTKAEVATPERKSRPARRNSVVEVAVTPSTSRAHKFDRSSTSSALCATPYRADKSERLHAESTGKSKKVYTRSKTAVTVLSTQDLFNELSKSQPKTKSSGSKSSKGEKTGKSEKPSASKESRRKGSSRSGNSREADLTCETRGSDAEAVSPGRAPASPCRQSSIQLPCEKDTEDGTDASQLASPRTARKHEAPDVGEVRRKNSDPTSNLRAGIYKLFPHAASTASNAEKTPSRALRRPVATVKRRVRNPAPRQPATPSVEADNNDEPCTAIPVSSPPETPRTPDARYDTSVPRRSSISLRHRQSSRPRKSSAPRTHRRRNSFGLRVRYMCASPPSKEYVSQQVSDAEWSSDSGEHACEEEEFIA